MKENEYMKKYNNDLDYLINLLEAVHPNLYQNISKEEIYKLINNLKIKDNISSLSQFIYQTKLILAKINDPHTILIDYVCKVPFDLKIIDDHAYIIRTSDKYSDVLFGEIISINDVDVKEIIDEIGKSISYLCDEWKENMLERSLNNIALLWALPSLNEKKSFTYEIKINNEVKKATFNIGEEYLISDKPVLPYSYSIDNSKHLMTIRYSSCKEDENYNFSLFLSDIKKSVEEGKISNFIVDLRGNKGGNASVIDPLIKYLKRKNIVTLVDKGVFSSGSLAVLDLRKIGSIFIGTRIGTPFNCFGDTQTYKLPESGLTGFVSKKYFYIDESGILLSVASKKEYDEKITNKEKIMKFFEPDIYAENSIDDYKNGVDRAYEEALQLFKNKKM